MIIPKDELTSYQRWQAGSFDKKPLAAEAPPAAVAKEAKPAAPQEPQVKLPTAEEIERMHEEARAQGYAAGLVEGREKAEQAARQLAEQAAEQMAGRFAGLLDNLRRSLNELDQSVADQLLALAIEIAAQVTRSHIDTREDALLPIVREAISTLPLHHAHIVLRLNPADAAHVRTLLGDELSHSATQIVDDSTISTGGCLVLAGASEIDATIETRWKRVLEAIGAEPRAWQNP
ncbi:MAG: flagellar assembly protein FliH [Betaproteobacteria bacterium HGW-Betaproteobacteria-12]|nr:MAG: flagellar assembly protein FliH [Betaproteobacteria bacterium HGW-Betaproteobacteria-12]